MAKVGEAGGVRNELFGSIANLSPSLFSIVMATGIVAMACTLHGMQPVGDALTVFNVGVYCVLWVLNIIRLVCFRERVLADLSDVRTSFGFFTMVAGTNVLGVQAVRILGLPTVAYAMWWFGVALWIVFTYAVFALAMAKREKPEWKEALGGGWLLAVVATQSCSVLGSQVSKGSELFALASGFWFCSGSLLYVVIIAAIFFRLTLFNLTPSEVAPPYWINMGAISITTLAGTRIIHDSPHFPGTMGALLPFFSGLTFLFWSFATWWIPLLVLLGLWKHAVTRVPLTYMPSLWAMVFPLGMYATCTKMMEATFQVSLFGRISDIFAFVALGVWSLVAIGFVKTGLASLRRAERKAV